MEVIAVEQKLYNAVIRAITTMGVSNFKKTSLFLSNERCVETLKRAA